MLAVLIVCLPRHCEADEPTFSKKAVGFPLRCFDDFREQCKPLRVPSPDGKSFLDVKYETDPAYPDIDFVSLHVSTPDGNVRKVGQVGEVEGEVVWSPDSAAFFLNGNTGGVGEYLFGVYRLQEKDLGLEYMSKEVQRDMVRTFLCRVKGVANCDKLLADPEGFANVVALDWIGGSSRIVVMAEVPCSSSQGGIMCQILGYELEVPSGKILRRMEAEELGKRWQDSMAWKFKIPDPPDYDW